MEKLDTQGKAGLVSGLLGKASSLTGLSPLYIKLGIGAIALIGTGLSGWSYHIKRFDKGFDACLIAYNEAQEELDGEVDEIMEDVGAVVIEVDEAIEDEKENYDDGINTRIDNLKDELDRYRSNDYARRNRQKPENDWYDEPVPDNERVRIKRLDRERENYRSERADRSTEDRSGLAGGPSPDPEAGSRDE